MRPTGGLKVTEVVLGTGEAAALGDTVTIDWRGWLNRGDVFGQAERDSFRIGQRRVIAGLERGVVGMRVGGVRRLRVSPHLGYRDQGVPDVIPAQAVLNFEVKLLRVERSS